MKTLAVFLLFLCISNVFTSKASSKALEQIREDEFGETFLNLIELNMRLKTPVPEISALLDKILQDLLADRDLLVQNYQKQSAILNDAITTGTSLIATYENTISVLTDSISSDQATIADEQTQLTNTQTALTSEQASLDALNQDFQNYVPKAQADINDLALAIANVKKAISRMQDYQNSGIEGKIFLQVSTSIKKDLRKITDSLESMKEAVSKADSVYTPVVQELLELTTNMTQDKAQKIIDLLTQLQKILESASTNTLNQLSTYKANYDTQQATLTQNIAVNQLTVSQLNDDITNLQQRITQSQADLVTTTQLRDDTQAKLAADQKSLEDLNNSFNIQDARYQRLIPLIRKVISYFNENIVQGDQEALASVNQ